jgi:hypothetical protein
LIISVDHDQSFAENLEGAGEMDAKMPGNLCVLSLPSLNFTGCSTSG